MFSVDVQVDFDKLDLNLSSSSLKNVKEIQNFGDFLSFIDHIWFCGFYKNFYPVYCLKKAIDVEFQAYQIFVALDGLSAPNHSFSIWLYLSILLF